MFLLFLTVPPSLSASIAVSSSAIPHVQLSPTPSPHSSQHVQPCRNAALKCERDDFTPGALATGPGPPSCRHPAKGKRARGAALSLHPSALLPSRPGQQIRQTARGGSFGIVLDSPEARSHYPTLFFPLFAWLHLAISPAQ